MEIRIATPDDVDAVAELHANSWRTACAMLFPAHYLDGPLGADRQRVWRAQMNTPVPAAALFVAEEDNTLLGFVYLEPQPDSRILLDNLHVRPGNTGSGLGRRLLRHSLAWSATAHPGQVLCLEGLHGNTRAIAFYECHGSQGVYDLGR